MCDCEDKDYNYLTKNNGQDKGRLFRETIAPVMVKNIEILDNQFQVLSARPVMMDGFKKGFEKTDE